MNKEKIKHIVEASLLAAGRPLSLDALAGVFGIEAPSRDELLEAIEALRADYESRGIMLAEVASGYRVQVRSNMADWISRLWEERPPRYSRALMETLALIAYRQPITRAEIEEIRGVSVSTNIVRTLGERNWVRVVGHRDVPGKPAMYGTTREFLDYFGLKRLDELPPLSELRDIDQVNPELAFESAQQQVPAVSVEGDSEASSSPEDGRQSGPSDATDEVPEPVADSAPPHGETLARQDTTHAEEAADPETGAVDGPEGSDFRAEERDANGSESNARDSGNVVPLKKPGSA
ncbi:MAG: SMC-Scp complex subunit ScpB [Gammaproteobacteria bacterium]|nr:MAG: SMC-Scp complex subunit ScpB [Gammaproteobacteria bacterium]